MSHCDEGQEEDQNQEEAKSVQNNTNNAPASKEKVKRGYKHCVSCNAIIGARRATCPECNHVYPFKGKRNAKTLQKKRMLQLLDNIESNYKHENFRLSSNNVSSNSNQNSDQAETFKQDHSSFMKQKPNFIEIEPQQKKPINSEVIDSYIHESQLLLDCATEQISDFADLDGAVKILNRALTNLTYLATLCDSTDYHHEKCPDLNNFI
mmetsp:Transcript_611/g.894  ORF Transcript_611/g.894 Transcript_611/m.894 type:complete len:208 (-) Transcript_611:772-1395(-)